MKTRGRINHHNVPDFSCEIQKPISYLATIHKFFSDLTKLSSGGDLLIDQHLAESFGWQMYDALETVENFSDAFYGSQKENTKTRRLINHQNVPDFSCEIHKPISYLTTIYDFFTDLTKRSPDGDLLIDQHLADSFGWMLYDALDVVCEIDVALYSTRKKFLVEIHPSVTGLSAPADGVHLPLLSGFIESILLGIQSNYGAINKLCPG